MNLPFFRRPVFFSATILLVIGLFLGLQPDFKKLFILDYKEVYVISFGYLPTWGIVFTLSIKSILKKNRIAFSIGSIFFYFLLHYTAIRIRPSELTMILSAFGAVGVLALIKTSEDEFIIKAKDYFLVSVIGALTFLPWGFENRLLHASLSVYLWQLSISHYLYSIKFDSKKTNNFVKK